MSELFPIMLYRHVRFAVRFSYTHQHGIVDVGDRLWTPEIRTCMREASLLIAQIFID